MKVKITSKPSRLKNPKPNKSFKALCTKTEDRAVFPTAAVGEVRAAAEYREKIREKRKVAAAVSRALQVHRNCSKKEVKRMKKEKEALIRKNKLLKREELKLKQNEVREKIKLKKKRKIELRKFIREEQAQVRKEQAEKQRLFYEKIKLEKKIEQYRKREAQEIISLEKFCLKQERENYGEVQDRIEKIKLKYQAIRKENDFHL